MSEFFNMGGYGGYVWPAWGVAVLVMGGLALSAWRTLRARERELELLRQAVRPNRKKKGQQ